MNSAPSGWAVKIQQRHLNAFRDYDETAERNAYGQSNPLFRPIRDRIPTVGAPAISGISPSSGVRGSQGSISVNGSNLDANTDVSFSGYGINIVNAVVTAQQITLNFSIASDADLGNHELMVETDSETARTDFNVAPPAPQIGGIAPDSGAKNTNGYIAIYGANLSHNPAITISGYGVNLGDTWVSDAQINVAYAVSADAQTGPHYLCVSTEGGTSCATFTVLADPAPPELYGIYPAGGSPGTSGYIGIYGAALSPNPSVFISGGGISWFIDYKSDSQVNISYTIDAGATPGVRELTLTVNGRTSNSVAFTIY